MANRTGTPARQVGFMAETFLVTPRHQSGSRRRAYSPGDVSLTASDSTCRNAIDVRRELRHVRTHIRLESKVGITSVIGEQDDDVGAVCAVTICCRCAEDG